MCWFWVNKDDDDDDSVLDRWGPQVWWNEPACLPFRPVPSRPVPRMSGVLGMLENKELATLLIRNKQQHVESKARHGSTSYWSFSIGSLNIRSVSETWTDRRTPSITRWKSNASTVDALRQQSQSFWGFRALLPWILSNKVHIAVRIFFGILFEWRVAHHDFLAQFLDKTLSKAAQSDIALNNALNQPLVDALRKIYILTHFVTAVIEMWSSTFQFRKMAPSNMFKVWWENIIFVVENLMQSPTVKEFWKLTDIGQNYERVKKWCFWLTV